MQLARVIRLDESDLNVFDLAAEPGEWAIPGTFTFSEASEEALSSGKMRQAFAHGWLGLESFGRATIVGVAPITSNEFEQLVARLAQHFVDNFGAPSIEAAQSVAEEEIRQMQSMCEDHDPNTMIVIERILEDVGIRERFRLIPPQSASLAAFAVHGDVN